MIRWLKKLRRKPCYVIIYDGVDHDGVTPTEEYYGYFSSPEEAKALWAQFTHGLEPLENVKLCRVVEDLPS